MEQYEKGTWYSTMPSSPSSLFHNMNILVMIMMPRFWHNRTSGGQRTVNIQNSIDVVKFQSFLQFIFI